MIKIKSICKHKLGIETESRSRIRENKHYIAGRPVKSAMQIMA